MPYFVALLVAQSGCFGMILTTPATYPTSMFFWEDGECFWLNGTIEDKRILHNEDGFNYLFLVNGTINNETPYLAEVAGDRVLYAILPVGANHEDEVCDSITLRDAFRNGTIKLIHWGLNQDS
mgnify:FL=1